MKIYPAVQRSVRRLRKALDKIESGLTKQRWVYLHLPKCGGTSVAAAFQDALGVGAGGFVDPINTRKWATYDLPEECIAEGSEALFRIRLNLFREYVNKDEPFIYGHFPLDQMTFDGHESAYRWVTVLREPVDRVLSQFKYYTLTREPEVASDASALQSRWQSYLDSDLAYFHCNLYAFYLGGHAVRFNIGEIEGMRARAKANLRRFTIGGTVEGLDRVGEAFREQTGFPVAFKKLNSTQSKAGNKRQKDAMAAFMASVDKDRLQRMCAGDREIYAYAE